MSQKTKKKGLFPMILVGLILPLAACSSPHSGWSDNQMPAFNTSGEIRVFHQDKSLGSEAIDDAFDRLREIDSVFSFNDPSSQIGRINGSAGNASVTVTDEVRFLVEEGLRHYTLSDGLFHIGLGNLMSLWGFHADQPHIPNAEAIAAGLATANIESVQLTGNEIAIQERDLSLHLDEMAKGYALDEAARVLRDVGITSGLIVLGDDVYALGEKPGGDSWHVWIKAPFSANHDFLGYLEVINLAVTTTGNDIPHPSQDHELMVYHQVLNPRTGRLVSNDLASVIVVSDTGLDGSIFSTTAFIMGLEAGYRYLLEAPGMEGLLITQDNIIYTTPGLSGMFHLTDQENYTIEVMVIEEETENE